MGGEVNIAVLKMEIIAQVLEELGANGGREPRAGCNLPAAAAMEEGEDAFPHRAADPWGWKWNGTTGVFSVWNAAVLNRGVWAAKAAQTDISLAAGETKYVYGTLNHAAGTLAVEATATEADAKTDADDITAGNTKVLAFTVSVSEGGVFSMVRDYVHGAAGADKIVDGDATNLWLKWSVANSAWEAAALPEAEELPEGTADNIVLRWNPIDSEWFATILKDPTNSTSGGTLAKDSYVVTDINAGPNGLIRLVTGKLPEMSGIPAGYSARTNTIIDMQWNATTKQIEIKRGTVLVKDAASTWSDSGIPVAAFND